jgi:hypothetical protein
MSHLRLSAAGAALILALALPSAVSAQGVTCKDGTVSSQSGRGVCSHHGGVVAQASTVSCKDGSVSNAGRGACSHHGGVSSVTRTRTRRSERVRASATESSSDNSAASASADNGEAVNCRDGSTSTAGRGACSHHGGVEVAGAPAPTRTQEQTTEEAGAPQHSVATPKNASAVCNDGAYSHSAHRSGACSHHGGVRQWLKDLPPQ